MRWKKDDLKMAGVVVLFLVAFYFVLSATAPSVKAAAVTGDQILLNMKFVNSGAQAKGLSVLQVGEVNTLSAAVATATRTEMVAAPSAGSVYLRGLLVEKATASTGSLTLSYGTGTNCGTGTTTLLGPITVPPVGYMRVDVLVPAGKALCGLTDASTTSIRVLAQ